jgi:hypothetical protein
MRYYKRAPDLELQQYLSFRVEWKFCMGYSLGTVVIDSPLRHMYSYHVIHGPVC